MARKDAVENKAGTSVKKKGRRVIAVQSFTDAAGETHAYGHEFEMREGAELDRLLAKKVVRDDDRMAQTKTEVATPPPAKPEGETK